MALDYLFMERHPDRPEDLPQLRPITPLADPLAIKVGYLMVTWGQFLDTLKAYTKNLIAFNGTDQNLPRKMESNRLLRRFQGEVQLGLSGCPIALLLARDAVVRSMKWYDLRNHLAHDQLAWGEGAGGAPVLVIRFPASNGNMKERKINLAKLEAANLDIETARGRLFQLALHSLLPLPYTSSEKATLQTIVGKGYLKLPTLPKYPTQPQS